MSKVWLVTGSASGLGRNIAEAVLAAGDRLVAQRAIHNGLKILWRSMAIGFAPPAWRFADEDAAYAAVKVAVDVNRRPLGLAGSTAYHAAKWAVRGFTESLWGQENSDPVKLAQVILQLADSNELPAHLLLGSDAIHYAGQAEADRAAESSAGET